MGQWGKGIVNKIPHSVVFIYRFWDLICRFCRMRRWFLLFCGNRQKSAINTDSAFDSSVKIAFLGFLGENFVRVVCATAD